MMDKFSDESLATMSLPERLSYRQRNLEASLREVENLSSAVDKLYAALSDDQKTAADDVVLPMMGMGMGSGGGGFGPGMMFGR
ncbi:hypothetical protein [Aurantimonas sp. 22II-16-19i]|uniref:hypothetical protein n=1 Tax=Aurantimonas sp. 22II-16-19i TaxID=1317114 RepID=UPI001594853A|nr:hypothetical protein [Aurantimonas sp. 22II-16-19i]